MDPLMLQGMLGTSGGCQGGPTPRGGRRIRGADCMKERRAGLQRRVLERER